MSTELKAVHISLLNKHTIWEIIISLRLTKSKLLRRPLKSDMIKGCGFILKISTGSRALILSGFALPVPLRARSARRDSRMPKGALRHTASVLLSPHVVSQSRQLWWAFLSCLYRPRRLDIFGSHEMKRMNVSNKKYPVVVPVSSITSSQVLSVDAVPLSGCSCLILKRIWCSDQ